MKKIFILGTRGVPAYHGGFETLAEHLSLYLLEKGWNVTVFCQEVGNFPPKRDQWKGVNRFTISVEKDTPFHTILFDYKALRESLKGQGVLLILGYNTGFLSLWPRLTGRRQVINMDGLEWKRDKWPFVIKVWFYINEWLAALSGNRLIADHPQIEKHLFSRIGRRKTTMIAYGAEEIVEADSSLLSQYGLSKHQYAIIIARPEPENSIYEIVKAFSSSRRDRKLVVLGNLKPTEIAYHRVVMDAASDEVIFPGAIYDKEIIATLRFYCRVYVHGHQVGGTNPSLVEAMGAGCPILAQDNVFNRWVTGGLGLYFSGIQECSQLFDRAFADDDLMAKMKKDVRLRFQQNFRWDHILNQYDRLLSEMTEK